MPPVRGLLYRQYHNRLYHGRKPPVLYRYTGSDPLRVVKVGKGKVISFPKKMETPRGRKRKAQDPVTPPSSSKKMRLRSGRRTSRSPPRRSRRMAGRVRRPMRRTTNRQRRVTRRQYRPRGVASPGNPSGGFFSQTASRDIWAKYTRLGMLTTQETGGTVTASTATAPVYVGHSTFGQINQIAVQIFEAVIKKMFFRAGTAIVSTDTPQEPTGATYTFNLRYRPNLASTGAVQPFVKVSATTIYTIAFNIADFWITYIRANPNAELMSLEINQTDSGGTDRIARMTMHRAKLNIMSKSSLKIQNVTGNNSESTSTDDLERSPIYGKTYMGSGSGMVHKAIDTNTAPAVITSYAMCTSNTTGVVIASPTENWWLEPPPQSNLAYVSRSGKAHLDPGQLKTSVLVSLKKMDLNSWFKMYYPPYELLAGADQAEVARFRYGKYAIYGLERMICYNTLTNSLPKVRYEHNSQIGIYVNDGIQSTTNQRFEGFTNINSP